MKQFLLPILTLLSFCAYAQKPATHDRGFSRLQLGVNVSPDICYRRLASPDGTNAFDSYIRASNDEQVAKLGFTGGFGFCLNFSRIVGLETGLRYANMGYRSKEVAFGSSNPKSPISGTYSVSYEYLEIPVKMNFTIGGGDIRFIGSAGLAASLLMEASSTSELTYADRKTTNYSAQTRGIRRINIFPSISAGVVWKLNQTINIRIEPTFRYGVLSVLENSVDVFLYSAGLNMGCYFGF